ncbi:MAG TPA: formyltransferase family protein, partial [Bacillota bacterium]|nr:formyltransferase family protein [Bacillota bacterium]
MKRIAVLASGKGSNLEAIFQAAERGELEGRVVLVISDRQEAGALERARQRGVKALYIDPRPFAGRVEYDRAIM